LHAAGRKTALIGTIEYHVAGKILPAPHTTPEALELNRLYRRAGLGVTEAGDGSLIARARAAARIRNSL
jgi:UDP-N-acetylmuramoyl-L-alanyl-D-glutamate--2,6-diaminopimelate ligase